MRRRHLVGLTLLVLAACPAAANASAKALVGIMDDAMLSSRPQTALADIGALRPQVVRFDVDWPAVAPRRPRHASNPSDPAYRFDAVDGIVTRLAHLHVPVLLTIVHTPRWAGGTARHNHVPRRGIDLQRFAYAVASRYSGHYRRADGMRLPRVSRWEAWNEPNTETHLAPQWQCLGGRGWKCTGGHWRAASPRLYAGLLRAIYRGVHAAGRRYRVHETVAGGATKPTGGGPTAFEPSIAPLRFLRLLARTHARFDVYSHHPYRTSRRGTPSTGDNVGFADLGRLLSTLDRLYAPRRVALWLTEYGIQTRPPDRLVGVWPSRQAALLRRRVASVRHNPRIRMFVWFLVRDEAIAGRRLYGGFQTGLAYANGRHKPAWSVFRRLAKSPAVSGARRGSRAPS